MGVAFSFWVEKPHLEGLVNKSEEMITQSTGLITQVRDHTAPATEEFLTQTTALIKQVRDQTTTNALGLNLGNTLLYTYAFTTVAFVAVNMMSTYEKYVSTVVQKKRVAMDLDLHEAEKDLNRYKIEQQKMILEERSLGVKKNADLFLIKALQLVKEHKSNDHWRKRTQLLLTLFSLVPVPRINRAIIDMSNKIVNDCRMRASSLKTYKKD